MESRLVHFQIPCKSRHSIHKLKMHILPHGQQEGILQWLSAVSQAALLILQ